MLDKLIPVWYHSGMLARSIRFEDETYWKLHDESRKRNVSFQWLVHKLVTEGLERLDDPEEFKVTS